MKVSCESASVVKLPLVIVRDVFASEAVEAEAKRREATSAIAHRL